MALNPERLVGNPLPEIGEPVAGVLPYPEIWNLKLRGERALGEVQPVLDELGYGPESAEHARQTDPLIDFGLRVLADPKNAQYPYGVIPKLVAASYAYRRLDGEERRSDSYAALAVANLDTDTPGLAGGDRPILEMMLRLGLLSDVDEHGQKLPLRLDPEGLQFLVTARYVAHAISRHLVESALVDPVYGPPLRKDYWSSQ